MELKGLPNIGNSCYFNASIQLCRLISGFIFKDDNEENFFIRDIQSLFHSEDQQNEINKYMRIYGFVANNLHYQIGEQQDSCEVLQFIIDKYVDLIYNKEKLLSVFNQVVFCINCCNIRICNEQKESMLISYELNNNTNDDIEFDQFISSMISVQNVEHINTECKCELPSAQVQTIFTSLPEYLFIKVGRCDSTTSKIYKKLKFSNEFDIDYPINLEKNIKGIDKRKVNSHYNLIGIILHHGQTSNTGHYSSIIKLDNNWFYCDDLLVRPIDIGNDIEYIQKNCCVLLYHKSV
jgi:ubiquitin C-terminal hydrolase